MSDRDTALAEKALGNAAFQAKDLDQAIVHFTNAINADSTDAVFYSNRSMAFATKGDYDSALSDGRKCMELRPEWAKAYSRAGLALFKLERFDEAKQVYEAGLAKCPDDESLKSGLEQCSKAGNPFAKLFGPDMWVKLGSNPKTAPLLQDPAMVTKLQQLQQNPNLMNVYLQDPAMMPVIGVLLGIDMSAAAPMDAEPEQPAPAAAPKKEPKPEPVKKEMTAEEKEEAQRDADSLAKKAEGNTLFKAKQYDEAIAKYQEAAAINPKNPVFHTNIASCHYNKGEFLACVESCKSAISIGQEYRADYKLIAKAYVRMGNAYKGAGDLDNAIESYEKALVEQYVDSTKQLLRAAQDEKKKKEDTEYVNPDLAESHKEKGNALFKDNKFREAIAEYDEAMKRDPTNYRVLSNRAFAKCKVMDWGGAMEDCNRCMVMAPEFIKPYARKGKIQKLLKQYKQALDTYNDALKQEPNNAEIMQLKNEVMMAVRMENASGEIDPRRREEGMKDPEVQQILGDPNVTKMLQDMQTDPRAQQAVMSDPSMRDKIEKLMAAGVLRMG